MRLNNRSAEYLKGKGKKAKDKDRLWPEIAERFEIGLQLRRAFDAQWLINLAFFSGKQYTIFNTNAWVLQQLKLVKGRIRTVDNQILPKVRRQIADGVRNEPQMSVVPNTNDQDDIKAAKLGDDVLKHFWRQDKMRKKLRLGQGWRFTTGNVFISDQWDPHKGRMVLNEDSGKLEYEGDVTCDIWSPFEIVVPCAMFGPTELDDFPWMIRYKFRPLEYFPENFARGEDVKAESMPDQMFNVGALFGVNVGSTQTAGEGANEIELFIKPCKTWPKGLLLTGANGIILDKQEYPFGYYAMEQFKDVEIPGLFWGMATMQQAIGLQKSWNRNLNSLDEFNHYMAKGKLLVPKNAGLEVDPDDTHGQILHYKPVMGHKPEMLTIKGLPATYEFALARIGMSLQDLFSQQEVMRGTNKSDIRSGDMVELLLEQSATGAIPSFAIFEESLEALMSRVLRRIGKGYTNERFLKIAGKEGVFTLKAFRGADLRGNTDVHVKRESAMPESRAARNAMVERRFKEGFYGPPNDPEVRRKVQQMLDDATLIESMEDQRLDQANAWLENDAMMEGGMNRFIVNAYDDHGVHLREHNRHRKANDYQKLKKENPKVFVGLEMVFTDHVKQHQAFIAEQRAQQLKEMAIMKGGGNG